MAAGLDPAATMPYRNRAEPVEGWSTQSEPYTGRRAGPSRSDRPMRSVSHNLPAPGAQRKPSGFPLIFHAPHTGLLTNQGRQNVGPARAQNSSSAMPSSASTKIVPVMMLRPGTGQLFQPRRAAHHG